MKYTRHDQQLASGRSSTQICVLLRCINVIVVVVVTVVERRQRRQSPISQDENVFHNLTA